MLLYVTADEIGTPTGGGKVTYHESRALRSLASEDRDFELWQFPDEPRPWGADVAAVARLHARPEYKPVHAHFYAGTFTETIKLLKRRGAKISYTAAAHDIEVSRREHELLGIPFDYPHLTDQKLWSQYVEGYRLANKVVCPSTYSAATMHGYGCRSIHTIPHGFDPPTHIAPMPKRFVVGYLGQPGADKGLQYLFRAWSKWAAAVRSSDTLLTIAGRGTQHLVPLIRKLCPAGSFEVRGEVAEPRELYDACAVYVQPSASEGFGCEVLEARAHGRPVICSNGAGARSFANAIVTACDSEALAIAIGAMHLRWMRSPSELAELAAPREIDHLAWNRIRERYVNEVFTWDREETR